MIRLNNSEQLKDTIRKCFESQLRESLDDIRTRFVRKIEQTSEDIWGATVIRRKEDNTTITDELDTWKITLSITSDMDIKTVCDMFAYCAYCYDERQQSYYHKHCEDYRCHRLTDWVWLSDECGNIIKDGQATLVKYAKILKKVGKANE